MFAHLDDGAVVVEGSSSMIEILRMKKLVVDLVRYLHQAVFLCARHLPRRQSRYLTYAAILVLRAGAGGIHMEFTWNV